MFLSSKILVLIRLALLKKQYCFLRSASKAYLIRFYKAYFFKKSIIVVLLLISLTTLRRVVNLDRNKNKKRIFEERDKHEKETNFRIRCSSEFNTGSL